MGGPMENGMENNCKNNGEEEKIQMVSNSLCMSRMSSFM